MPGGIHLVFFFIQGVSSIIIIITELVHLGCLGPPNGTIFRSQVLGELACSGHLEAGWHSSFSLVASQRMNANGRRVLGCYSSFGLMRHILSYFIEF